MGQAEALDDRLPWLPNEPAPAVERSQPGVAVWLVAAALLLGGVAYWLLFGNLRHEAPREVTPTVTTTIALPRPKEIAEPEIAPQNPPGAISPMPPPEAQPVVQPPVEPRVREPVQSARLGPAPATSPAASAKPRRETPRASQPAPLKAPASTSRPSSVPETVQPPQRYGGLVQVSAFADLKQARPVWTAMVSAYPALAQFHPSLIENRDWNGRPFYQFQIGTASPAQSLALCQAVRGLSFRCEAIAIP